MPGTADASQYTQFKKANAVQRGDTQVSDPKSVNRLTQYVPKLSFASNSTKFLSSLTNKNTRPLVPTPINVDFSGKKQSSKQNCS
jgi:hypothetical protein